MWVELTTKLGWEVSVGRVHRLYRAEGLMVRRLKREGLKSTVPLNPLLKRPNQEWALDFVSDALSNGRALRTLTMVDRFTRECPQRPVVTSQSFRRRGSMKTELFQFMTGPEK